MGYSSHKELTGKKLWVQRHKVIKRKIPSTISSIISGSSGITIISVVVLVVCSVVCGLNGLLSSVLIALGLFSLLSSFLSLNWDLVKGLCLRLSLENLLGNSLLFECLLGGGGINCCRSCCSTGSGAFSLIGLGGLSSKGSRGFCASNDSISKRRHLYIFDKDKNFF